MKARLLPLSLLLAGLIGAAPPLLAQTSVTAAQHSAVNTPDPARQIQDLVRLLRANDVAGLARAMVPPSRFQEAYQAYEYQRSAPISEDDRVRFTEKMDKFLAADAVEQLMAEIEPKLQEARPQAEGAILMAMGGMQMAVSSPKSKLSDEQRAALKQALPGIQRWVTSTDFLSSLSMRQALTVLTEAARDTGISNLDQLKMLPLDEVLARSGTLLVAAKQALRIYGLDLDAIAATTQVQVLASDSRNARVRITVTIFDAPISREHDLTLVEGRWYGKEMLDNWHSDYSELKG